MEYVEGYQNQESYAMAVKRQDNVKYPRKDARRDMGSYTTQPAGVNIALPFSGHTLSASSVKKKVMLCLQPWLTISRITKAIIRYSGRLLTINRYANHTTIERPLLSMIISGKVIRTHEHKKGHKR